MIKLDFQKELKIIKPRKKILILLVLLILFLTFSNCKKEYKIKKNLTEYFSLFPHITKKSKIVFNRKNVYSYILEGWSISKQNPSIIWKSSPFSYVRVFFGKEKPEKMIINCRANISTTLKILSNEKEISSINISKGYDSYEISLSENIIQDGLNIFNFVTPSEIHKRRNILAFNEINFLPVKRTKSYIKVSPEKKSIEIHGSLYLYYFLRTYEKPQISFLIRALNDSFKNELKIVVENLKGEKKVKRIHINSRKWKKEILDLSSFRNQIIKVSFYHFGEAKNVTEIKNPYFKDRYSKEERKVIMIGLDGATWKIIDSLIEKGKLQNLNKLIKSGARGNLKTIKPWYSPLVWTSILTGKNKEKHGIKGFIAQRRKTGETIPNSRLNRKCLAIWNILSGKKHVVGIVGPWVSWPAEKVNGYILSDRMFFENLTSITFPSELKSLLFQKIKPYKIKMQNPLYSKIMKILDSKIPSPRYSLKSNIKNEKIYLKQDDLKQYAGLYLNNIFRPDFFFLYMRGPDVTSHFFWKYFEPDSSVSQEEIKLYGKLIPMNYIYQDYVIGKYISKMDSNTTFIIVSDHGMDKKGYKPVIVFDNIPKLFEKIGIYNYSINKIKSNSIELFIKNPKKLNTIKNILSRLTLNKQNLIFEISINNLKNTLKLKLQNPYSIDYDTFVYLGNKKIGKLKRYIQVKEISGDHTLYGILIIKGKGIKKNYRIRNCSVLDITPTILYLLGLPVAKDMDGRVLTEIFTQEYLRKNPITYIESYENLFKAEPFEKKAPHRERKLEKELLEQLRSLGYIK